MAGLYLHIPFCKSRCVYCGFYSTTLHPMRSRYVDALCREMELRAASGNSLTPYANISTIYLGVLNAPSNDNDSKCHSPHYLNVTQVLAKISVILLQVEWC